MSYDPGRCFWCENVRCEMCNGTNEWANPHASATIGEPCKCMGKHPYSIRPRSEITP